MKLVDANVLIYAINSDAAHHERSRQWLEETLSGSERVGMIWGVLLAFLRVTTRRGILERPLPADNAVASIDSWLLSTSVRGARRAGSQSLGHSPCASHRIGSRRQSDLRRASRGPRSRRRLDAGLHRQRLSPVQRPEPAEPDGERSRAVLERRGRPSSRTCVEHVGSPLITTKTPAGCASSPPSTSGPCPDRRRARRNRSSRHER